MTALTVTATGSGAAAAGILLRVLVLDNAAVATAPTQNGGAPYSGSNSFQSVTGQGADNSVVYSVVTADGASAADTPEAGNTAIDAVYDSTHGQARSTFSCPVSQASNGLLTVGAAFGNGGTSSNSVIAWCEIDPVGGTITQDPSTPAAVNSNAATTVTTAAFTPPPGSLILVLVSCNASGSSPTTIAVSTSLNLGFTPLAGPSSSNINVTPEGLAAQIFYVVVPPAPIITTTATPGGAAGEAYSFTLNATSGTPPYTSWAVTSGSLPGGLTLSTAGVISGTPTTAGVYSFAVTVTDTAGFTTAAPFSIVVNANSTPGGTIRATWALSAAEYSYGTLEVPVSTQDHDWLFVSVSWMAGEDAGIAYVADSVHNLYQAGPLAASGNTNTQVFVVPNARATTTLYVSTSMFARWLNVQITEVTGLQPGYVIDAFQVYASGPATSLVESLSTANADFILAVGALAGAPQTIGGSGSGVTWTALTGSFNGSSSAGVTQALAWAQTTGAASPSLTFTGVSGFWSGVMIAVKAAGGLPVNANKAWPVISCQAAFGYTPQQPTAAPVWTDITSRFLGVNGQRGRSFELDEISAADMTASFDNHDGALSPQNTASPYYPNVTLITPVRILATWQGRVYPLFRGLLTAVPQTYDFQWGIVEAAASDDFSKLPNILLPTCFIQEMLYDNPLSLWPLNDQQGAPFASNWSGRSNAQLIPTIGNQGFASTAGGSAPATQLTVKIFGITFPISSAFFGASTAAPAAAAVTAPTTPSTSNTPATGFGNAQSGTWPSGLASTTDTVWGNTTAQGSVSNTYQGTALVDSNDTLPLTSSGATYAVWAQMYNIGASINQQTGATVFTLTDQNGTGGGKEYLAVYYNGTNITISQTAGSHNFTPSATLFDSHWHLWTVTVSTAGVVTLYIDGVSLGSFTGTFPSGTPTMVQWGGDTTVTATVTAGLFTGLMSGAGVYDRVVDLERIQTWFLSGSTGFLDEYAGTRIQRVLAWARWSAPQAIDTGLSLQQQFNYLTGGYGSSGLTGAIGNFQTAGGSAAIDTGAQADMTIQDIANTENGLLAMLAGGEVVFRNRNNLTSFPGLAGLGDMDFPLNGTVTFGSSLGEWVNTSDCTVAASSAWSYDGTGSGLMTATGGAPILDESGAAVLDEAGHAIDDESTAAAVSVSGGQWPIQGTQAGFSGWVMSPQGCWAMLGIAWYGPGYSDTYQANYTDNYGLATGYGLLSTTSGTLTWCPPMTPVFLTVPATAAPSGTQDVQGVITIGSSPATGTQLYFDRTRLSPAGFQVPYLNDSPGDVAVTEDIQYLYNDIAVTRNVDQVAVRVRDATSRSKYYPRIYTRTIFSSQDDPNALVNCADTLLAAFAYPVLRVTQVEVDAAGNPDLWPFVLGTDIGDLVTFTRTPVGGATVTGSFLVLSIAPQVAPDKAQFTYVLCPTSGVF